MIRKATPHEAGAVRQIVLDAYHRYVAAIGIEPAPMRDDYVARIAQDHVWVVDDGGVPVAALVLKHQADCFLLDNIAVRPDRQGFGYGRILLDFAEAEAQRQGWHIITLYTNALMTENIAIYSARGYVETERRTENGFDRVYMQKSIR